MSSNLGRVTKAYIVIAVAEGVSLDAANRIMTMKKLDMVHAAEQSLPGTGWLPIATRTIEPKGADVAERLSEAEQPTPRSKMAKGLTLSPPNNNLLGITPAGPAFAHPSQVTRTSS